MSFAELVWWNLSVEMDVNVTEKCLARQFCAQEDILYGKNLLKIIGGYFITIFTL